MPKSLSNISNYGFSPGLASCLLFDITNQPGSVKLHRSLLLSK